MLRGETRGYRHHSQLDRFRAQAAPVSALNAYLAAAHAEALSRDYAFDRNKLGPRRVVAPIAATKGQVALEGRHLMDKLSIRSPALHQQLATVTEPNCHPLFRACAGTVKS